MHDVNDDGLDDLLLAANLVELDFPYKEYLGKLMIQILISNGDGTFRDESAARYPQSDEPYPDASDSFQLHDLDGDGHKDLFSIRHVQDDEIRVTPAQFKSDRGDHYRGEERIDNRGALKGRGLELAYLPTRFDVLDLHIQDAQAAVDVLEGSLTRFGDYPQLIAALINVYQRMGDEQAARTLAERLRNRN